MAADTYLRAGPCVGCDACCTTCTSSRPTVTWPDAVLSRRSFLAPGGAAVAGRRSRPARSTSRARSRWSTAGGGAALRLAARPDPAEDHGRPPRAREPRRACSSSALVGPRPARRDDRRRRRRARLVPPDRRRRRVMNLRAATYRGKPVLTWWEGKTKHGLGDRRPRDRRPRLPGDRALPGRQRARLRPARADPHARGDGARHGLRHPDRRPLERRVRPRAA